jgi:hypothetical protein
MRKMPVSNLPVPNIPSLPAAARALRGQSLVAFAVHEWWLTAWAPTPGTFRMHLMRAITATTLAYELKTPLIGYGVSAGRKAAIRSGLKNGCLGQN